MCLKLLVAARRQREMIVIIATAENVKSACDETAFRCKFPVSIFTRL